MCGVFGVLRLEERYIMEVSTEIATKSYLFPSELGISLPALVLVAGDFQTERHLFSERKQWYNIQHQAGGIGCEQFYFTGTVLRPTSKVAEGMEKISECWQSTNSSIVSEEERKIPLEQLLVYQKQLQELLGVDCRYTYRDFRSGLYPIDFSPENLRKLCMDELPQEMYGTEILGRIGEDDITTPRFISALSDFFITKKEEERDLQEYVFNWQLFILGHNYRS